MLNGSPGALPTPIKNRGRVIFAAWPLGCDLSGELGSERLPPARGERVGIVADALSWLREEAQTEWSAAMAADLQKRGPADPTRVNVNEPWEIEWWSKKWSISPETLRAAVKKVGVMANDVADHLGKPVP